MRSARFGLLVCTLLLNIPVWAQQTPSLQQVSPPQPTRDPQSLAVLVQAVTAMGGAVSTSQPIGVIVRGTLTAATGGISGPILWENVGTEFRYERPGTSGSIAFVSGHGRPALIDGNKPPGKLAPLATGVFPAHLPATVLVSELNNSNVRVDGIQHVTVDGVAAIKVPTEDDTDELSAKITKQDWYFDPTTMLPFRVDYLTTNLNNLEDTANMTVMLSDFRSLSGVRIPFHIVRFFNGQQIEDTILTEVQLNVSIPASNFDAPTISAGGVR